MAWRTIFAQWEQFVVIFIGFICMGAGTGFERSLLPRMAVSIFHQYKALTRLNFVATFGASKALANAFSGPIADKFGRKPTLILGFLLGLPVMPYVIVAESWTGITIMNILFGLSQGLLGSALFFLLIDLLGPRRRGIAVGLGECLIYVSTALVNILAGRLATRYGFRPVPFYVATGFAVAGLLSTVPLKDTLDKVRREQSESQRQMRRKYARLASMQPSVLDEENLSLIGSVRGGGSIRGTQHTRHALLEEDDEPIPCNPRGISEEDMKLVYGENGDAPKKDYQATLSNRTEPSEDDKTQNEPDPPLQAIKDLMLGNSNYVVLCFTGMVVNFKDGFAWGSFPVFFSHEHSLTDADTDLLVALYPLCWGFSQAFTGALSDRFGRKLFLVSGTGACALSMALYAIPSMIWGDLGDIRHVTVWIICDILLGIGTALAYPALQAGAADEVDPINRGAALGFYRFVRDFGYVVGAVVCGRLTDDVGYNPTFFFVAAVLAVALGLIIVVYTPQENLWQSVTSVHVVPGAWRTSSPPPPPPTSIKVPAVSSAEKRRHQFAHLPPNRQYSDSM
jgi:MFS family permease